MTASGFNEIREGLEDALEMAQGERVTAAAIRMANGRIFSVEPPLRHHDCIQIMRAAGILFAEIVGEEQGFLTSAGRFVDRKIAFTLAQAAGQIRQKHGPSYVLFSEDVW